MLRISKLGIIILILFLVYYSLPPIQEFIEKNTSVFANYSNSSFEVHFINVGQGDATFFRINNYTMLIDCGPQDAGKNITAYLTNNSVWKIDYLVMTHTDADHIGGCPDVLEKFYVKTVMLDGQERNTEIYKKVQSFLENKTLIIPKKYDKYKLEEVELKVLHANVRSSDPNQNSIVLFVDFKDFELLMTGDCDRECEKDLEKEFIDVDVLKVAHHGSKYATYSSFLKKSTPELAVIQVGKNKYNQPSDETIQRLEENKIRIVRTDLNGTIILKTNGKEYTLSYAK